MISAPTYLRRGTYVFAAIVALSLASCASDVPPTSKATSTPSVPVVVQSPTAPQSTPSTSSAPAQAEASVKKFFDLLATNDPDEIDKAEAMAAPRSLAAAFAKHVSASTGALQDGGEALDAGTAEGNGLSINTCDDPADEKTCTKYTDIMLSGGAVSNFTVNGKKLEGRLSLGQGDKVKAGSFGTVEFVSAYRTTYDETLYVDLTIVSGGKDISLGTYEATYRDPSGRQIKATDADGLTDLDADSNTRVSSQFKKGKPGGVVTLPISDKDFNKTVNVKIKVG